MTHNAKMTLNFKLFGKFDFIFEIALAHDSEARWVRFMKETRENKSRESVFVSKDIKKYPHVHEGGRNYVYSECKLFQEFLCHNALGKKISFFDMETVKRPSPVIKKIINSLQRFSNQ
jgi:hypothetical protein